MKKIFFTFFLLILIAFILAPWKQLAEFALHAAAAHYGYPQAEFTVDHVSLDSMTLRDISLGEKVPLAVDALELSFPWEQFKQSQLSIKSASARWQGGTLSTQNASVSWKGDERLRATVSVRQLPLDALLKALTSGHASATGLVSGELPLVVYSDNSFSVRGASLNAASGGTIALSPDAIPGDNAQVELVTSVLGNFHYDQLSLSLESDKAKQLSMLLQLSGNNPDMYNGREVKLNVRLTGDVLSFLQQSVLPMGDPKQFLEQKK